MVLGGEDRNVEELGAYVAWLINSRMFTDYVERTSESAITDVRLQSSTGRRSLMFAFKVRLVRIFWRLIYMVN